LIVPGSNKAWSVEQTIAALKKIETVHITGKTRCRGKIVDFDCWVHTPAEGSDLLRLRYQCGCEGKTMVLVRGNTMYEYRPQMNAVHISDCSKLENLQYWYEGVKISPWLTGKLLETLRLVGRGWQQTTETDPNTGKEQIVVTCNHPPSNRSARMVVDPESKLVCKGKLWSNLRCEGQPEYDVQAIVYNPAIPDEFFEFQALPGAAIVTQEMEDQAFALFRQATMLFREGDRPTEPMALQFREGDKYTEALTLYREAHERFPRTDAGQASLRMIGRCYDGLGQRDLAIEAYQRALQENPEGGFGMVQFYLGRAYLDKGQTQEALKAFEDCLAAGEGIRQPDEFPLKDAREYIAKIKGQ